MLYLLGVNLPDQKTVPIALTHIYGVGPTTASQICHKLAIHPRCRLKDLPEEKVTRLSQLLNTMTIDAELRREKRTRIAGMIQMGSYRGDRHQRGYPVNGQRTHTNRRTAKKLNRTWVGGQSGFCTRYRQLRSPSASGGTRR
ncbi:hypothetical protein BC832DRAFT_387903 [Gaertneriomyces semiglobifer]|nr:hypothetical protein BC832DRAFT_387903 [Gaertneriomyces semiglobifer]